VLNEEVINKSLQILDQKKLANKNAMAMNLRTLSKKATINVSASKTKKLEPFSKKITQQDEDCDIILDDLDEKNDYVESISKKLRNLRNSVADEFEFMD